VAPPLRTFEDDEARTSVAEDVSRTADLGPLRSEAADIVVSSSDVDLDDIDRDLGEDIPTDASLNVPEIDASDPANRDMTARLLLAEPTARIPPRMAVTLPMPRAAGIAMPLGETHRPSAVIAVPLQAPPTGRVPLQAHLSTPLATPPTVQRVNLGPSLLPEIDPSSSSDTPLPPVPDPRLLDDTTRHPLAEPLRQHLASASSLKLLRVDESSLSDSMSMTIPEDRRPEAPKVAPPKRTPKRTTKRATRGFRQRAASLELSSDPVPTPTFGDGILDTKHKKTLPWPVIGGAAALLVLLLWLFLR
jgi:hypothetical protein